MFLCIYIATNLQLRDRLRGRDRASLEMHLEAEIEWTESCTWRPWSSEFGDALGGRDGVNWELHLEAVIDRVWRCSWRPRLTALRDALGGRDRVHWEMHLEAVIEGVWRCTWRPRSSALRDALGGRDRASLVMHLEPVIEWTERCTWSRLWSAVIDRVWICTGRPWSSEFGDAHVAGYDRARLEEHLEVVNLEAVDGRRARCWGSISNIQGSTRNRKNEGTTENLRCMLYSVYAALSVNSW